MAAAASEIPPIRQWQLGWCLDLILDFHQFRLHGVCYETHLLSSILLLTFVRQMRVASFFSLSFLAFQIGRYTPKDIGHSVLLYICLYCNSFRCAKSPVPLLRLVVKRNINVEYKRKSRENYDSRKKIEIFFFFFFYLQLSSLPRRCVRRRKQLQSDVASLRERRSSRRIPRRYPQRGRAAIRWAIQSWWLDARAEEQVKREGGAVAPMKERKCQHSIAMAME